MTVIASDGLTIAADGQLMLGQSEIGALNLKKIRVVEAKAIYAMDGTIALLDALIDWHRKGADPHALPVSSGDDDWGMVVITTEGVTAFNKGVPYPARWAYPLTLGCGADYAMGAMLAGASPQQAVEIACAKNAFCGGDIQVIDIKEALGVPSLRAVKG